MADRVSIKLLENRGKLLGSYLGLKEVKIYPNSVNSGWAFTHKNNDEEHVFYDVIGTKLECYNKIDAAIDILIVAKKLGKLKDD